MSAAREGRDLTASWRSQLDPQAVAQIRPFMLDEELREGAVCDEPGPECLYWLNCMTSAGYVAWPLEFQAALQASFIATRQQIVAMVEAGALGDAIGWAEFARTYRLLSNQLLAEAASLDAWVEGVTYGAPTASTPSTLAGQS